MPRHLLHEHKAFSGWKTDLRYTARRLADSDKNENQVCLQLQAVASSLVRAGSTQGTRRYSGTYCWRSFFSTEFSRFLKFRSTTHRERFYFSYIQKVSSRSCQNTIPGMMWYVLQIFAGWVDLSVAHTCRAASQCYEYTDRCDSRCQIGWGST